MYLGVNIDHVATVRQARYRNEKNSCGGFIEPDPVFIAQLAERAGADGITMHLREDRRHIVDQDVVRMRAAIATRLNLEMACTDEMLAHALAIKPDFVCLVPEGRDEVTTEGGLDVIQRKDLVQRMTATLSQAGILVSLFIDPDKKQIETAAEIGAPFIELHTGAYAQNYFTDEHEVQFNRLVDAAEQANQLGLTVNAGHGINYTNIGEVCTIPHLHELNIGHSIISRSLSTGIEEAVSEMKNRMLG